VGGDKVDKEFVIFVDWVSLTKAQRYFSLFSVQPITI